MEAKRTSGNRKRLMILDVAALHPDGTIININLDEKMDFGQPALLLKRLLYLVLLSSTVITILYNGENAQAYWLMWSAYFLSLIATDESIYKRMIIIVVTGLVITVATFMLGCLTAHTVALALLLISMTFVCVMVGLRYKTYYIPALLANMLIILAASNQASFSELHDRVEFIMLGLILCVLLQGIFIPHHFRNAYQECMRMTIMQLKRLCADVFYCLVHLEYSDNVYLFERRLHEVKKRVIRCITTLHSASERLQTSSSEAPDPTLLLNKIGYIYDLILECAQIRRRVTDYTVFSLCKDEFTQITSQLSVAFDEMLAVLQGKENTFDAAELTQGINQLESNYQHVLQVTAREPLVFILFITTLKALRDEMISFCEAANKRAKNK